MRSHRLGRVNIDPARLKKEISVLNTFQYSPVYDEFVCGELKSCMLWNRRGDNQDAILESYHTSAKKTLYGEKLPYIHELIDTLFHLEYLRFARILKLSPNSVFMPHRDYLEIKQDFLRIHLPLKTDAHCFHAEEEKVYHMDIGEVWYLDATKIHTAASFSTEPRLHLILDFAYTDNLNDFLKEPLNAEISIPETSQVKRPALESHVENTLLSLSQLICLANFYDVFAILIKQYFLNQLHASVVYDWLLEIAQRSQCQAVIDKANFFKEYCLLKR